IQDALDSLPENLEGTYERMLQRIPETKWKYAHHLFQCLAFSARPLSVAEAAEILVIDFDTDPIPILRSERRLSDPEVAIMSTCSTLVVVVSGDRPSSRMVQFAHMSVQDYLTSDRLSQSVSDRVSRYHVIPDIAHSLLAQVCLSTIIFGGRKDPDGDGTPESPLHHYSDLYWTTHVQFNGVSPRIAIALTYFLDPQRPGFDGWAKRTPLYDFPDSKSMDVVQLLLDRGASIDAAKNNGGTALHIASLNGHLEIVRLLLDRGASIGAAENNGGGTALHIASLNGHLEVVRLLLDRGASIDASTGRNATALHIESQKGHLEVVRLLLDRGASIDASMCSGATALYIASRKGHLEVVRLLLD
ncbi:ankyrin repeat-containing domain protein, partial [Gloeopeniophorella convolvens]